MVKPLNLDADMIALLAGVVGVVEANRFETMCLWQRHHKELGKPWIDNLSGRGVTVGHVEDMPVFISLRTAVVDGCKLLFIEATSQVVDWRMIDAWLARALPQSAYRNKVDAGNFVNVFPVTEVAA